MTVYCPNCGSARIWPQDDPATVREEDNRELMQQYEKCMVCRHIWLDKWWKVTDESGEITIHEVEDKPS